MGKQKLVGYKIKRPLKSGDMLKTLDGLYEEVYEPLHPLEELADYAYGYAYMRNDPNLGDRVDELVKQLTAPKGFNEVDE